MHHVLTCFNFYLLLNVFSGKKWKNKIFIHFCVTGLVFNLVVKGIKKAFFTMTCFRSQYLYFNFCTVRSLFFTSLSSFNIFSGVFKILVSNITTWYFGIELLMAFDIIGKKNCFSVKLKKKIFLCYLRSSISVVDFNSGMKVFSFISSICSHRAQLAWLQPTLLSI